MMTLGEFLSPYSLERSYPWGLVIGASGITIFSGRFK